MADLLSSWGLEVHIAYDARQALESVGQAGDAFDIVITDQTMPDLSGLDLAGQLMILQPSLPVILYTGFTEDVDEASWRSNGISAFFRKPVDTERLRQTLTELLCCRA
ncbi:response regulator [Marinobacterium aestuariivivens]|uniref:Response regulator n=1 Tax=Marinobacterium aestuariivivens TaxID=1698799 RepID=A0ABW2A862_9GAMM